MPLHLHYVDSVALFLDEIFSSLIKTHFDFKLKDSFRIITPDLESREDVEGRLLLDPRLEGVLIGKSILSLSDFWRDLLRQHPEPRPIAGPALERKALRLALRASKPGQTPDYSTQGQYLRELKRASHLQFFKDFNSRNPKPHPLMEGYQSVLRDRLGHWSAEQAIGEAAQLLRKTGSKALEQISEIFFLGFHQPDRSLVTLLLSLLKKFPDLKVFLFLPPPERVLDPQGFMTGVLEELEKEAEQKVVHSPVPLPSLRVEAFPTPLHEGVQAFQGFSQTQNELGILTPNESPSREFFERLFFGSQNSPEIMAFSHRSSSTVPFKILDRLKKDLDSTKPIAFQIIWQKLSPLFEAYRNRLALQENVPALKHLEACYEKVRETYEAETFHEEVQEPARWLNELHEEFKETRVAPPLYPSKRTPVRALNKVGLRTYEKILMLNLNDGFYPPKPNYYLLLDPAQDPLFKHERKLSFEQNLYLAKDEVILSFAEFSLSGRALAPSLLIGDLENGIISHRTPQLRQMLPSKHPYFSENIKRENHRRFSETLNLDQGNLTSLALKEHFLSRVRKRPLSASYLNDYAKCPWLFFARWHLNLEEIPEEALEIEPRLRGTLLHAILEKIFRGLIASHFSQGKVPTLKVMQEALESSLKEISGNIPNSPYTDFLPKRVLEDEIERLKEKIFELLKIEHEAWTQAEKKLFPKFLEWNFGRKSGPTLSFPLDKHERIPLAGAIDRIDLSEDKKEFLVVDYKSSGSEALSRDLREKQSFQLFIYLYAVQHSLLTRVNPLGALYWDIKTLKKNQGMVQKEAYSQFTTQRSRTRSFMDQESFDKTNKDLEEELRKLMLRIFQGDYSLDPPDCLGSRCLYHEICRYENQPR